MVKRIEAEEIGDAEKELSDKSDASTLLGIQHLEKENDPNVLTHSINAFCETLRSAIQNNQTDSIGDCIKQIQIRLRRLSTIDKSTADKIRIELNVEFDNAFLHTN